MRQLLIASQIDTVVGERGRVTRQLAFGLCLCGLIGRRIDLKKDLLLMNHIAFAKVGCQKLAGNLSGDLHHGRRHHRADGVLGHGHIAALRNRDLDRRPFLFGCEQARTIPCGEEQNRHSRTTDDPTAFQPG